MTRTCYYIGALVVIAAQLSCAPIWQQESSRAGAGEGKRHRIVVIKSAINSLFDEPLKVFTDQVDYDVSVYVLANHVSAERLQKEVRLLNPSMVFCLGARAATLAAESIKDIPILFAMVPNYQRFGLGSHDNVIGISLETPPVSDFMQFKLLVPRLSKVLVFYSAKESGELVKQAQKELGMWGVEMVTAEVNNTAELQKAYSIHASKADGIWLQNDAVVMNPATFEFLNDRAKKDRLAFLTSLSERFARAGALASVSVDLAAVGSQAANLARLILDENKAPKEIGVEPPIGGRITVNLDTALLINLEIPKETLVMAHEVISSRNDGGRDKQ